MPSQGPYYRAVRKLLRLGFMQYTCHYAEELKSPVVYICRHRNTVGPISTLCLLPLGARPWVLSVFTNRAACRAQLSEYTFPVTWRIKPRLSRFLGRLCARPFTGLVQSTGAITVYRNSLQIRSTFQDTIAALENGDDVIIYPDVNYVEENASNGSLYDGFLMLEYLWNRKTHGHIHFVPVNISASNARMDVGRPITFPGLAPYAEEKATIIAQLEQALDSMAQEYGL